MKITHSEWKKESIKRYGENPSEWKFICPSCGVKTKVKEWVELNAKNQIAFSCIGRSLPEKKDAFTNKGPCNYAGGGLFRLNPILVIFDDNSEFQSFDFADNPLIKEKESENQN